MRIALGSCFLISASLLSLPTHHAPLSGQVTRPPSLFAAATAFDSGRGRLVVFGGEGAGRALPRSTWEADGDRWILADTAGPTGRFWSAGTYDPVRRVTLVNGGVGGRIFGDTWTWDGSTWRKHSGAGPPARFGHEMVWDPPGKRVLLFGGNDGRRVLGDLWAWDGASWSRLSDGGPARSIHGAAWDSSRGRLVVYGGIDELPPPGQLQSPLADLWEWDGTRWAAIDPPQGPPPADHLAMAYDPVRGRSVLIGFQLEETWEWDGTRWYHHATKPPLGSAHRVVWDPDRERVVVWTSDSTASGSGILTWDGESWMESEPRP